MFKGKLAVNENFIQVSTVSMIFGHNDYLWDFSLQVKKWKGVVKRNREAETASFPLEQPSFNVSSTQELVQRYCSTIANGSETSLIDIIIVIFIDEIFVITICIDFIIDLHC